MSNLKKNKNNESSKWTTHQEQLLVNWAEKASGYAWMHNKSVAYYKKRNVYISVPASIFGYISGTTALLTDFNNQHYWVKGIVGVSALLAGLLSNFQQMFTYKELGEQHRISYLRFMSFFRDISSELSMSPENRAAPIDYITMKRLELDKMLEQSPIIPEYIIEVFNQNAKKLKQRLHKPEVANILQTIEPFNESHGETSKNIATINNNEHPYKKYILRKRKEIIQKYFLLWKVRFLFKKSYIHKNKEQQKKSSNTTTTVIHNSKKNRLGVFFSGRSYKSMDEDFVVEIANSHITSENYNDERNKENNNVNNDNVNTILTHESYGLITPRHDLNTTSTPKLSDLKNIKIKNTNMIQQLRSNKKLLFKNNNENRIHSANNDESINIPEYKSTSRSEMNDIDKIIDEYHNSDVSVLIDISDSKL